MIDYKKELHALGVIRDLTDLYLLFDPFWPGRKGLENQSRCIITLLRMCETLEAQYVKLLRKFLWWFISLTSLSILPLHSSHPPWSPLSFLFPPIQSFSSCHSWAGGPSPWEVKGHFGWEGGWQVVRALCTPFPIAGVKCCWTLTPVGLHSQNCHGTQFILPDPIQDRTFHWRRKECPHPNCGYWPSLCLLVKQGRTTGRH